MSFPLSSDGTVSVYGADLAHAVAAVGARIDREGAATLSVTSHRIDFTSTDAFGFKSPLIGVLDSGTVAFRNVDGWTKAQYRVSFRRALAHVTVIAVLIFGIVPVLLMGWHPGSILFVAAGWSCLFGVNYLTATARFRAALQQTLEECRHRASPEATRAT